MIQFLSVTKKYSDEIVAIDDISFEIEQGEFVFLVGPSGSGKTSIIRLLIREELPTTGKIFFNDEDITSLKRRHVYSLRRKIGVIFQDFKLIPELTAYENVGFAMEAAGKTQKEIDKSVPYLLEIVGLENRMSSFPNQLSGGEKQRVAIARAMANNPKLLIADEPTGNLDPDSAWDIVQILSKINSWGTTVIMSTHGFDIVNTLNKRVIRLNSGQLISDDFKGSYTDLDDYSIKILNNKQEEQEKEVPEAGHTKKVKSKNKFKTKLGSRPKKKQKDVATPDDIELIILREAKKTSVNELDLTKRQRKILTDNDYNNLKDIIDKGTDNLAKIKDFKKKDIKDIALTITNFVNSIETHKHDKPS